MSLYHGEYSGGRVFQQGASLTSAGTNHQGDFTTWPVAPGGEMGDCLFRSVGIAFTATNGWSVAVTAIVDGVNQTETTFGGTGATDSGKVQIFLKKRGSQIAVRVRTLNRSGSIAFSNVLVEYAILRVWP